MFRSKMTFALTMNWCAEIAKAVIRSRRSIGQNGLFAAVRCALHQGRVWAVCDMLHCAHFETKGGNRTFAGVVTKVGSAGLSNYCTRLPQGLVSSLFH
ncbi:hypothetical protein OAN307_c19640 [Octadecabacter antarcticus 307]|uniref:Uncharacterized protein n=1 Tax=Octadecabacter antarcticus 307 TaxID=391626 RepID=M9R5W4_9RHOB|nr:hypothetical protein OAN307_c19640 [Octadecabacter antarcticus 307]